jgi:DNA invertase Pin-like site-specific DNA recombinase
MEIVSEYIDRAVSGKTDNRPEFRRMIADSINRRWDVVLVYKTDRFARNKYDCAIYKTELRRNGVRVICAAEANIDGPEGIILESLMEGLAEYYSAELSQKIKRGMNESALKGKATGGGRCLGYKANAAKDYEIVESEAEIVRKIFAMYIEGHPVTHICAHINSLGYRTVRGELFKSNSICRIIQNQKYTGQYRYHDVIIDGGLPPIISEERFHLAQRELKKRTVGKQPRLPKAEYLLSGKAFCGHCKTALVGVSGTGRGQTYFYYYCPTARGRKGCNKKHVRRDWLEDLVVQQTVSYVLRPEFVQELAKKVCAAQPQDSAVEAEIAAYEQRLKANDKKRKNIMHAIEDGMYSPDLKARLTELEQEVEAVKGEQAHLRTKMAKFTEEQIEFMLLQFATPGQDEDWDAYKRKIIDCFVSAVYLYDDKLIITYNITKGDGLETFEIDGFEEAASPIDGFDQGSIKTTI